MAERPVYSLWIRPYGELAHKLHDRIRELSKSHDTTPFEPHVTLLGGLESNEQELTNLSDILAHSLSPFTVDLTEVDTGNDYYHCVYIKAKKSKALMHAHKQAAKVFDANPNDDYKPHLSLLYGKFSKHEKERIISKMTRQYYTSFKASNLLLVKTSGAPDQWKRIHSVDFTS